MSSPTCEFTCALLLLLSCLAPAARGACPAGLSWSVVEWSGSCYQFVDHERTWMDARAFCRNVGGKMATVDDQQVQKWLVARIEDLGWKSIGVWIGLNDRYSEGRFGWDDYNNTVAAMSSFSYWKAGEPGGSIFDQDCVYMRRQYGWRWVDVECNLNLFRTYNFICQYRSTDDRVAMTTVAPALSHTSAVEAATTRHLSASDAASTNASDRGSQLIVVDGVARSTIVSNVAAAGRHLPQAVGNGGNLAAHRSDEVHGVNDNAYVTLVAGVGAGLLVALLLVAGVLVLMWQMRWRTCGVPNRGAGDVVGMDNPAYLHRISIGDRDSRLQRGGVALAAA